ncbi:MAG: DUF6600 domain-containing protein [Verrucomicrobiota bacterium]|jgi:hypothetical protein
MNPRTLGSSILLTVVVAVTVLLIGAFAHFDNTQGQGSGSPTNPPEPVVATSATPAPHATPGTGAAVPPTLPADLSPGLAEVIRLAQSHVAEETIVAFIQNSGKPYSPTADEVLYLYDLGLSDKVISALFKKPDAVAAAPTTSAPPPASALATPDAALAAPPEDMVQPPPPAAMVDPEPLENPQDSYFYNDLAPYGSWVQVIDFGWCWQPMVSSVDASWLPYRDRGHWVSTDEGWYWASDYSWGWATFHYGRWSHDRAFGWVWSPGSVWAPAWVAWRDSDNCSGWAPLPPNALFQPGIGLFAGDGMAGVDASFGLGASAFTFVTYDHFLSPRVSGFAATAPQAAVLYKKSTPVNNYSVQGRKVINSGVSPDRIAAATKTPVRTVALQEALSPETSGGRVRGAVPALAVFRPDLSASAARSSAGAPAPRVLINKTSRQEADNSGQAAAPVSQGLPDRTGYSGFTTGNFQPPPKRVNPPADVSAPAGARPSWRGSLDASRASRPFEAAAAPGYAAAPAPSSSTPRGYNGGPSAEPAYAMPERREPSYNPPPQAGYENRGGGQIYPSQGQGPGSAVSSTTSSKKSN